MAIDAHFERPSSRGRGRGDRSNRGDRGERGGRSERRGRGARQNGDTGPLDVGDEAAFPSLPSQ